MKSFFVKILIISLFLPAFYLKGQDVRVSAKIDSTSVLIGDQFNFFIDVNKPRRTKVIFHNPGDSISEHIEVLESKPLDTLTASKNQISLRKSYKLTSFDSGLHAIPPIPVVFDNPDDTLKADTLFTDSVFVAVNTIQVDTTKQKIYDIKKPYDAPWTFMDFLKLYYKYILGGLLLILLAIGAIYFYKKLKRNEPIIKIPEKPKEPAHIIAYRKLDELKDKKLWQNGKVKEYYIQLTDVIRKYLEHRYGIIAMELTSNEILSAYKNIDIEDNQTYSYLSSILTLADFAKFAKANPLPNENDLSLKNAYKFVDETKKHETKEENENSKDKAIKGDENKGNELKNNLNE